jgi:uncharacterized OsmC-like protein
MMTSVRGAQAPLRTRYKSEPAVAMVVDRAQSAPQDVGDPFHAAVVAKGAPTPIRVATHAGHGGPHDDATPGDVLCAALASCYELTIRMVAGAMGLELAALNVEVQGDVDLRGSLGMPGAPVAFQRMRVSTRISLRNGGPAEIGRLLGMAQALCVVGQTLRSGVAVEYSTQE